MVAARSTGQVLGENNACPPGQAAAPVLVRCSGTEKTWAGAAMCRYSDSMANIAALRVFDASGVQRANCMQRTLASTGVTARRNGAPGTKKPQPGIGWGYFTDGGGGNRTPVPKPLLEGLYVRRCFCLSRSHAAEAPRFMQASRSGFSAISSSTGVDSPVRVILLKALRT